MFEESLFYSQFLWTLLYYAWFIFRRLDGGSTPEGSITAITGYKRSYRMGRHNERQKRRNKYLIERYSQDIEMRPLQIGGWNARNRAWFTRMISINGACFEYTDCLFCKSELIPHILANIAWKYTRQRLAEKSMYWECVGVVHVCGNTCDESEWVHSMKNAPWPIKFLKDRLETTKRARDPTAFGWDDLVRQCLA